LSVTASLAEAHIGYIKRLREDDTVTDLIVRVVNAYPKDLLVKPVATELPVIAVHTPQRIQLSDAPPKLWLQTDTLVWPADDVGGLSVLNAIDNAVLDLFMDGDSARTWSYTRNGVTDYFSSVCIRASDPMEKVLRRTRLWEVTEA